MTALNQVWGMYIGGAFVVSLVVSMLMLPQVLKVAQRYKLYDVPDERKVHVRPIPRLGGVVFMPAILFSIFLVWGVHHHIVQADLHGAFARSLADLSLVISSLLFVYFLGIGDDLLTLKAWVKFVAQVFCAALLIASGVTITNIHGLLGVCVLDGWLSISLTALVIVFVTNAINLIDGVDGLASSLGIFALLYYLVLSLHAHLNIYALIAAASIGAILPFVYFNVFGRAEKGRKIFMGDTGTLSIGLLLSVLAMKILGADLPREGIHGMNPLIMAFAPLLLPCLDVIRVFFYRISRGRSPLSPDRNHIHHYLLDLGLSHRQIVAVLLLCAVFLTVLSMWISIYLNATLVFVVNILLGMAFVLGILHLRRKKRAENEVYC